MSTSPARILWSLAILGSLAAVPALADEASGRFAGASGHETEGEVTLVRTDAGWEIRLGEDFVFDGAPDPRIGFGTDGSFAEGTDFEALRADKGAQTYSVPDEVDAAGYDSIVLWCRQFSVPLGVARLD